MLLYCACHLTKLKKKFKNNKNKNVTTNFHDNKNHTLYYKKISNSRKLVNYLLAQRLNLHCTCILKEPTQLPGHLLAWALPDKVRFRQFPFYM